GVGSRVLAASLDVLFQGILQFGWVMFAVIGLFHLDRAVALVLWVLGAFLIDWAYFAGTEILMHGRTPGKRIVGLRGVTREGGSASRGALLTRILLRIVALVVGVPLMAIDPLSRRLGDRLAGTIVVHDSPAAAEPLLRRIPKGWKAEDVALVES